MYQASHLLKSVKKKGKDNTIINKHNPEATINQGNRIRRAGQNVEGKCLGTTALTKGLEFDTVAILDAHSFTYPKNLYVALTRASKKLIIFSKTLTLTFLQECGNLPAKYLFP